MITLIALSRLTADESQTTKPKKGTIMNPLTQFKRIRILPLLIALALVALAPHGRARGRGDRLEPDCVERDRRDCGAAAAGVGAALRHGAWGGV